MILSPLFVSVQLRAYIEVERSARKARPKPTQCVAEFVMQPRELMKVNAVVKAMTPTDYRYEAGSPDAASFSLRDPFATGAIAESMPTVIRFNLCMRCHGGKPGVRTQFFRSSRLVFHETTPEKISKVTSDYQLEYKNWKKLKEFWKQSSKQRGEK